MPTTTLARHRVFGAAKDKLDEFTMRTMNALLHRAALYVVEENGLTTRTLILKQVVDRAEEADQPVQEQGEGFETGDGHHELARYREAQGFNHSEGEE